MANPILKLGLPKGSLEDPTIDLFDRAGWKVRKHPRNYFPDINDPEITARLCRVQEIPLYIQDGVLDLGLTGKDWVKETKADVVVVSDLIYSKVSNKPARWVLAVADDSPYQKPEDLAGKRIATELMGVCTEYFKERNIPVNINYSWGATEAKVVEGLADAIVEVTSFWRSPCAPAARRSTPPAPSFWARCPTSPTTCRRRRTSRWATRSAR